MPAGYDAEVADLFQDFRVAISKNTGSNLTEADLAARIATPVEVVQALEQGAIYALPPWPETARVVNAYGSLLNLDTRPLLRRIYAQIEAGVVELGPKPVPDVPVMPPQAGGDAALGGAAPAQPQRQPQPQPQGMPQAAPGQPGWQNGPAQPQPQAPHPQTPLAPNWPGGAPQAPHAGMPGAPGQPPQQAPAAPAWSNGPQGVPQPQVPNPAAYQQPPQAYPPEGALPLQGEDASFEDAALGGDAAMGDAGRGDAAMGSDAAMMDPNMGDPAMSDPAMGDPAMGGAEMGDPAAFGAEPEPKKKRPALLKWGIAALVASVVLVGLWMFLGDSSDSSSSSGSFASDPVLDPDDPRSRKADRLPSKF